MAMVRHRQRASPARTHTTGTNQMLERTLLINLKRRTDAPYPLRASPSEVQPSNVEECPS